ncbi:hypothetical protein VTJ04DRAFT_9139 [Mycothermus thermophilus]|uniref:uncharacterized protein n=1 Tax=Humicola insolens TaxID=85995 RepID=UPI00374430DC
MTSPEGRAKSADRPMDASIRQASARIFFILFCPADDLGDRICTRRSKHALTCTNTSQSRNFFLPSILDVTLTRYKLFITQPHVNKPRLSWRHTICVWEDHDVLVFFPFPSFLVY